MVVVDRVFIRKVPVVEVDGVGGPFGPVAFDAGMMAQYVAMVAMVRDV